MNRLPCWLLGLGLSLLLASVAAARDEENRPEPPPFTGPFLQPNRALLTPELLEKLKLTDEQKEKVAQIRKDMEGKQKEMMTKIREAMEKARQDPEAQRKVAEQFRSFQESAQKQYAAVEKKLQAVLTDEQKQTYLELKKQLPPFPPGQPPLNPPGIPRAFPGQVLPQPLQEMLRLSPEQKAKIAKMQKEAEEKIVGVLNEEQKKKLDEVKKHFLPPFPPLPNPPPVPERRRD